MTKWVTSEKDYKNQGVEIKVSCERANLCYAGFQSWDYEGNIEQELYEELDGYFHDYSFSFTLRKLLKNG